MEDLSRVHELVSDLFKWPSPDEAWERFRLTDEQVRSYHENGYLSGVRLLDSEQVDQLRRELDEIIDPDHPKHGLFYEFHSDESKSAETTLFHALGAWRITPGFHDILWNPAFLIPAFQLLGGPVRFWHDQLFCKPAHHGGVVAWHQDYSYWTRTVPLSHLTCWMGLDDSTTENGCVYYIPGSHRWELLPVTGLTGDMKAIYDVLTEEQKAGFKPVASEVKAGECSFHHGLMVHGSFENRSSRPRRGVVLNVTRDGVVSSVAEPLLEGVPALGKGVPLGGQFFPLLYSGPSA